MADNDNNNVDISGIDKVNLLEALWKNSSPAAFFSAFHVGAPAIFNRESAEDAVKHYIDYFDGRCIKTDISEDTVDPHLYDRDFGKGKFTDIVKKLRGGVNIKNSQEGKPKLNTCVFSPYGKEMLPNRPDTIMCTHCGDFKRNHLVFE